MILNINSKSFKLDNVIITEPTYPGLSNVIFASLVNVRKALEQIIALTKSKATQNPNRLGDITSNRSKRFKTWLSKGFSPLYRPVAGHLLKIN